MAKTIKRIRVGKDHSAPAHMALSRQPTGLSAQDTLINLVTGMGTEKDKLAGTIFGYGDLNKQQLDAAYRGDWISRKVVDIPAYDAFREWRHWEADKSDITAIEDLEKSIKVQRKAMLAAQRGRLYGGGALILGVDQGTSEEELIIETLKKDCLKFVHVVSRHELSSGPINWDVMSPWFGEPSYYTKSGDGTNAPLKLHPSRVVRFLGNESADPTITQGWGDSLLQVCADAILACGTVASSVAQLVAEAKIDIVKMPELSEKITNAGYEDRLKKRMGIANTMKSVFGMLIVDKEEEWDRIQQQFTALPDILKMYLLIASGAADIPATRMLGQSPTGLSATGDSDTRNYYDRVSTEQSVVISPAMERLDKIIIASALGALPDDIFYEWNPLWQMDEQQKAAIAVQKSSVMTADVNAGLITPIVLQKARENQLIEDGTYPGLEGLIEEFGDDITAREPATPPPPANSNDPNAPAVNPNDPAAVAAAAAAGAGRATNTNAAPDPTGGSGARGAAVGDATASRIRKGGSKKRKASHPAPIDDATTPRTLYVRREVLNQADIKAWAKAAGFNTSVNDMHVTIAYSKVPVDWLKAGDSGNWGVDDKGNLIVKAGGPRVIEKFGKAVVLAFANSDLSYRHMCIRENTGADWSYEDYTPHVTITYDGGALDVLHMQAYDGEIKLGPEIFEEIKPAFNNEIDVEES